MEGKLKRDTEAALGKHFGKEDSDGTEFEYISRQYSWRSFKTFDIVLTLDFLFLFQASNILSLSWND